MNPLSAALTETVGPSYRPFLFGILETACIIVMAIAVLPQETWNDTRTTILSVALIVAKTVKDFVTKDKEVTGTTTTRRAAARAASAPANAPTDRGDTGQTV